MKKCLTICLIVILFACGCENNIELQGSQESLAMESDYSESWDYRFNTASYIKNITKSEHGYFFMIANYLFYMDYGSSNPVVLCNKPNCSHDSDECNAYLNQGRVFQIAYYSHGIYAFHHNMLNGKYELIRVSENGETRETLLSVNDLDGNQYLMHQGKLFYLVKSGDSCVLTYYDIPEKSQKTIFSVFQNEGITELFVHANDIFFCKWNSDENGEYSKQRYRYHIADETCHPVSLTLENGQDISGRFVGEKDGGIVLQKINAEKNTIDFSLWSNESGTVESLCSTSIGMTALDEAYIAVIDNELIQFYDYSGVCLNEISLNAAKNIVVICSSDEWGYIFCEKVSDDGSIQYELYQYDKSKIGSDSLKANKILSVSNK